MSKVPVADGHTPDKTFCDWTLPCPGVWTDNVAFLRQVAARSGPLVDLAQNLTLPKPADVTKAADAEPLSKPADARTASKIQKTLKKDAGQTGMTHTHTHAHIFLCTW